MNSPQEQVQPETAAMIIKLASAQGLSVDEFLRSLLPSSDNGSAPEPPLYETATPTELAQAFLDWAYGHDRNSPGLTLPDVSRARIYEDR